MILKLFELMIVTKNTDCDLHRAKITGLNYQNLPETQTGGTRRTFWKKWTKDWRNKALTPVINPVTESIILQHLKVTHQQFILLISYLFSRSHVCVTNQARSADYLCHVGNSWHVFYWINEVNRSDATLASLELISHQSQRWWWH